MKNLHFAILFFCLLFIISCYKDKFRELHPEVTVNTSCDTSATISYSTHIVPIINNNCINCHGANGTFPDLSTYEGVQTSSQASLYGSVIWDGSASQMPKNSSSKLSVCDLTKIKKWIDAGAPNN